MLGAGNGLTVATTVPSTLERPLVRMRQHYADALRLADLSALAGMSVSHFIRTFKRSMGGCQVRRHLIGARCNGIAMDLAPKRPVPVFPLPGTVLFPGAEMRTDAMPACAPLRHWDLNQTISCRTGRRPSSVLRQTAGPGAFECQKCTGTRI